MAIDYTDMTCADLAPAILALEDVAVFQKVLLRAYQYAAGVAADKQLSDCLADWQAGLEDAMQEAAAIKAAMVADTMASKRSAAG